MTTNNETLADEVLSINAIYPESFNLSEGGESSLKLPETEITLLLHFPPNYPEEAPTITGSETSSAHFKKGQATEIVQTCRDILTEVFMSGEPCVFDFIEALAELDVFSAQEHQDETEHDREQTDLARGHNGGIEHDDELSTLVSPDWILSDVFTEKKSVFVARAAKVHTPDEARRNIRHLLLTDKKAAKATHNISAHRIRDEANQNDVVWQDCDDDGESAAGSRLLHLLEVMGVWNVQVVVSRWYGGIHLGPDRFRIINATAKEAIVRAGLVVDDAEGSKKNRKA